MSINELGVHFAQKGGLGQLTKEQLNKKGIKSPKVKNGYHPNGDTKLTVYQPDHSEETREEWEKRMDLKYDKKIVVGEFGKLR